MAKAMLHLSEHVNGFGLVLAMPGATALSLYSGCLSLYSFPTRHTPTNQPPQPLQYNEYPLALSLR
jgi:hypothetical protein